MSTTSALPTMGERRIGLRARDYNAPSIHPNLKRESPAARQPTPDEDIFRPPDGSSDEDAEDSDFGDAPPLKKRKKNEIEDSVTMESIPLPSAPSDIKPTVWSSSQRNAGDMDDDSEDLFGLSQKSQTKSRNKYGKRPTKNIHSAGTEPGKPKKTLASPAKTHQDTLRFTTRDTTDLESKCMDPFALILRRS